MRRLAVNVLGLAFFSAAALCAQGTGSISGVVQDQSGAVIPGVDVTVANVDTGIESKFVTDATGGYHVPSLNPGLYRVQAQKAGFTTGIRQGIQLTVGSDLEINIPLIVGQTTQQTVVNAEAPIVDTVNSSVGALVEGATIRDLPLNGRSFDQLITLDSATPTFNSRGRFSTFGEASDFSMNGAHTTSNLFMMDGTEMLGAGTSTTAPGGVLGVNLGVDAIAEFEILSSNYSANYGKKAGGIINIATRSGTNQFHGSAFEFLRNSAMDARNFFDGPIPPFKRNNFGGAIGGPIKKDSSFFFFTYEGRREILSVSKVATLPDANAHQGLLPCAVAPTVACNTSTGLANVGVAPSVAPYLALPDLFPIPNGPGFGDGSASFISSPKQINNAGFYLGRFDQRISEKDSFFGRFNLDQSEQLGPLFLTQASPLFYGNAKSRDQMLTLEEKRNFSPTFINLFRFGYSRGLSTSSTGAYSSQPSSLYFEQATDTIGAIKFSSNGNVVAAQGLAQVGLNGSPSNRYVNNQFDETDQIFKYLGKHSLLFGIQFQRIQTNNNGGGPVRGTYVFSGGLLAFLQGKPSQFTGVPISDPAHYDLYKSYRRMFFNTYVQDDYKITRNLTLNLGLRYELLTVPTENYGRISNYLFTFVNGFRILNPAPTLGGPLYAGNHLNFAPRFGFAWDPTGKGKMSVRGGYGLFYDNDLLAYGSAGAPFAVSYTVINPPFPNAFTGGSAAPPLQAGSTVDPNRKTTYRMQYSLGIQRQITSSTALSVGYVGSHSTHVGETSPDNTAVPTFLPVSNCSFSCSAFGQVFYPQGQPRLQPLLGSSSIIEYDASGSYNSLQTDFTQRLSHGLRYKVSYTWAKNIDITSGTMGGYANGEIGVTQNPFNRDAERGPSPFNQKHSLATNFTYDLPWKPAGLTGKLLGGWQLGGILTRHSGTPFTVTDSFSNSRDLDTSTPDRPSYAPGVNGNSIILGGPNKYFNSSAYVLPPVGYYGNVGRNTLTGPGFLDVDFTLHKAFSVTERIKTDFRAEFFNILNHSNFDLPSAQIFSGSGGYLGTAGHISATVTTSRQVQLALKLTF